MGLFQDPDWIDGVDESMDCFSSLLPRKTVTAISIPGLSSIDEDGKLSVPLEILIYDSKDFELCRIGKTLEFYGILTVDGDQKQYSLHLISAFQFQFLPHRSLTQNCRDSTLEYLSACFGSETVALLLLVNLVSTISERQTGLMTSLLIGYLPLNLILDPSIHPATILDFLSKLCPSLVELVVESSALEQSNLSPIFDANTNTLSTGRLQLTNGTHTVINETKLQQGQLGEKATKNLQAIMNLLDHQQVDYDFGFQTVSIDVDLPVIILSYGKSIFSVPWKVSISSFTSTDVDPYNIQTYIIRCRECSVTISTDLSKIIESDYVSKRQSKEFDENDLSMSLSLAKYQP